MSESATVTPPRGNELLRTVVNKILTEPSCWDQAAWHCGTKHCIGGWSQILGGMAQCTDTAREDATKLLELGALDATWLFDSYRTLPEIHGFAAARLAGKDYFEEAGFNRAGFDRDGFNRAGFNRAGFDRDGFNRAGFDRAGFNRAGFNRAGFNRAGKQLPLL